LDEKNTVLGAKPFMDFWMYLKLTLREENGSDESHIGLSFLFVSQISRANLSEAQMLLGVYVQCMFTKIKVSKVQWSAV